MTITFHLVSSVSNEARDENAQKNKARGYPEHRAARLAVVGGGPSIRDHVAELKAFDGAVWAVNGAINWCLDNGIDAWFYTVDAQPVSNWTYDLSRIRRAAISIDSDPSLFDALSGAEITTLEKPQGGPTSANCAAWYAIRAGYLGGVTYYGCEGSFGASTHAFTSHPIKEWIVVRVGGNDYRTKPEFLQQAQHMAETIRRVPAFYAERSGGLLAAMVEHGPDYELIEISKGVKNMLRDKAA